MMSWTEVLSDVGVISQREGSSDVGRGVGVMGRGLE